MNIKLPLALGMSLFLAGCNSNPAIFESAIQGALGEVINSAGLSTATRNSKSDDFIAPGDARRNCHYFKDNRCGADFGTLTVTTQINRYNTTLVRYGNLIEGASGGRLKESSVSEQMFPYIERGLIDFESGFYVSNKAKAVRAGKYYFKGSYGSQNPSLAVGNIVIKPGVTNIINATYD